MKSDQETPNSQPTLSAVGSGGLLDADPPKKRFEFKIVADGHTKDEALANLVDTVRTIQIDGVPEYLATGCGLFKCKERKDAPEREEYRRLLNEWLDSRNKESQASNSQDQHH